MKRWSDYKTNRSDITQEKLSQKTGVPDRTIRSSIKRLKDGGYLGVQTKISDGFKKRNSYHFKVEKLNVALIDNDFFHKAYKPKIAGFMLLMRTITLNNTNEVL
ncbi:HTH domain-containing protein [uncultured Alistipes sp.]|uniref:HTH domain-containing protein n=1 Tax=uncultured Alistipes sp. TaxID=538949 RepID=UPI00345157F0